MYTVYNYNCKLYIFRNQRFIFHVIIYYNLIWCIFYIKFRIKNNLTDAINKLCYYEYFVVGTQSNQF